MILRLHSLVLLAAILAFPLTNLCAADDVKLSADTPVSSIIASAKSFLAKGAQSNALTYFDAAIARDPSNYLAIFQRGATYLSIGRQAQASVDFDRVLNIKPDFEGALQQRARIRAKGGDWAAAREDYVKAGKDTSQEMAYLEEAQGAALLAAEAERKQDWEGCVSHASVAIMTASTALSLRQLRARCRFEKGEVQEGVNDLNHVLQISPGSLEPYPRISAMLFYSLGDMDRGVEKVNECLRSDADYEPCKKLRRREKQLFKTLEKVRIFMSSQQFNSASKLLAGAGEDAGVLAEIKEDVAQYTQLSFIHPKSPNALYAKYVEWTCECFREMNSPRRAAPYCVEALTLDPTSLHGLLYQAQKQLDAEEFDAAIASLNTAKENYPGSHVVQQKLQEAQVLLKRSKQKDYYKVLGIDRDADDRTIKRAYRNLVKVHHPDKAVGRGMTKEQAEKKMAQINEAYEVLSDAELKEKFDRGEDPNDPMAQQGGQPFQGSPFGGSQQFFFQQNAFTGSGGGGGGGGQRQFKFQQAPGGGGFPFGFPG